MKGKENPSIEEAVQRLVKRDRYLGVLWEKIDEKLSIVIEGNDALEHKINRVDAELKEFRAETNEKFEAYSEDIKSLRTTKADKTEVGVLERRVTRLEKA